MTLQASTKPRSALRGLLTGESAGGLALVVAAAPAGFALLRIGGAVPFALAIGPVCGLGAVRLGGPVAMAIVGPLPGSRPLTGRYDADVGDERG